MQCETAKNERRNEGGKWRWTGVIRLEGIQEDRTFEEEREKTMTL